jgi:hypothetical protein
VVPVYSHKWRHKRSQTNCATYVINATQSPNTVWTRLIRICTTASS